MREVTERHTMKLTRNADGMIVERGVWDADVMVDSGLFAYAAASALSQRERVEALSNPEIVLRMRAFGGTTGRDFDDVAVLTTKLESGDITIP